MFIQVVIMILPIQPYDIFPTNLFVLYVNLNTFIIENKNGQLHQGA